MVQRAVKKTVCGYCANLCGVLVHVEDGNIVKIEGNPEHPLSQGFTCERCHLAIKWLYHPDQLMYPLKRVGQRGEGRWQRVGWDEALAEIGGKLNELKDKYGPETLGVFSGTYRGNDYWPCGRFLSLFGNPQNIFGPGIICGLNQIAINNAVTGDVLVFTATVEAANCVVCWGHNPAESNHRNWITITRLKRERELKLIVIDPRRTASAEIADIWLQLRPGTDGALALGWLNVIINEGLYDKEFVERWTVGFDRLAERVQEYPPQRVAQITGLAPDEIIESARIYATTKPACMPFSVSADHAGLNGTRTEQARAILRAITGDIDVLGGHLITRPGEKINGGVFITGSQMGLLERLSPEQRRKQMGFDVSRLMSLRGFEVTAGPIEKLYGVPAAFTVRAMAHTPMLWPAILSGKPYPIKAMICWGSNPMAWAGNLRPAYEALKSPNLELHVVQELFMTPTAQLADYVFPAASWMERVMCTNNMDFASLVFGGERPVPPLGERRDIYEFFRGLGLAVGQGEHWPWETLEEVGEHRLRPLGITFKELVDRMVLFPDSMFDKIKEKDGRLVKREYEETGFPTPSGKAELYSSALEKLGYDPLPFYEEPPESPVRTPEVAREYPLILTTGGRFMPMYHSEFRQQGIGSRERHPDPLLDIHPETARELGIGDGDWAFVETRRGRIKQKARYNPGILPDVVNAEASWWFPEQPAYEPNLSGVWQSNTSVLTLDEPEACDELSGGWCNRALLCKVYKA
jgi:anaerobic selenocysteine-containing dehydrogenase